MGNKRWIIFFGLLFLILISPYVIYAESQLVWDPPVTGGAVDSYRLYWRTAEGDFSDEDRIENINETAYPLKNLGSLQEKTTYYFVVRAYNTAGESENSNEVPWIVPDTTAPATVQGVIIN